MGTYSMTLIEKMCEQSPALAAIVRGLVAFFHLDLYNDSEAIANFILSIERYLR